MSSGCTLPTRMTLVILVLFSVSSRCEQDTFRAPAEVRPNHEQRLEGCCGKQKDDKLCFGFFFFIIQAKFESGVSGDAFTELKRYEDIDYDSFVSLMGRRSAAQPNSE